MSNKKIEEYDDGGNLIHYKPFSPYCYEKWFKYDENNNRIYYKRDTGIKGIYYKSWHKYDEKNNIIHYKNSNGYKNWYKYDKNGKITDITEKEFKEIEFRKKEKEYLSRTKVSRFELMEI